MIKSKNALTDKSLLYIQMRFRKSGGNALYY